MANPELTGFFIIGIWCAKDRVGFQVSFRSSLKLSASLPRLIRVSKWVFLRYWAPVLVWMSVIFTASADTQSYQHSSRIIEPLLRWLFPSMPQKTIELIHEIARKCCHLAEYSIFAVLLWRAFSHGWGGWRAWPSRKSGTVLLIVFLYACSDEFHQLFVPTRTARFTDVLIDTAGGGLGLLAVWLLQRAWKPEPQTSRYIT